MLWLVSTLILLAPQSVQKGRNLTLPGRPAPKVQEQDLGRRDALQQRFHAKLLEIRRSVHLAKSKEQAIILRLGEDFDDIPGRAIRLASQADPDLMHGIMRVLQAYGTPKQAAEIRYLLLTRKFGSATLLATETMAMLARDEAKEYLFQCLSASSSALRKHSADLLMDRVGQEDGPRIITIAREESRVRVKALQLLGAVKTVESRQYLIESLSSNPLQAETACRALINQGESAAADLQEILRKSARGRDFAYAAFALTRIGEAQGELFLGEDMREHLIAELDMPDPFVQSAVAIALSTMAWNSTDSTGEKYRDGAVLSRLVRVVAPREFVSHLALIQPVAERQLKRFSGQDQNQRSDLLRQWGRQMSEAAFVGSRRRVEIDQNNADLAVFTWEDPDQVLRFFGPEVGDLDSQTETEDYVLSSTEILGLLSHLTDAGFMRPISAQESSTESSRSLHLTVGLASCRTEPAADPRVLDGIFAALRRCALDQRWQLYRNPKTNPDPVEFWRQEQTWLEEHPDTGARNLHLKELILGVLPSLDEARFELAVQHLLALPRLGDLLTAADGEILLQAARTRPSLEGVAFQVLELALLVPSDEIWREVLGVAEERYDRGGRQAMARIFAILGPDRLLISLRQGSKIVRLLVMDELAQLRDMRAVPDLLELIEHKDRDLRRSSVFCLGKLQAIGARGPLLGLLETSGQEMDPYLRRTVWVALARIGGSDVLPVLESAAMYTDPADRRAVITALGVLDHPSAARELARMYAMWGDNTYGQLAMQNLRRKGDLVASPILEEMLLTTNQAIRRQIVLLLGEFQHPAAFPELLNMLTEEPRHLQEISLIAGITGQDVTERNDRVEFLRAWYRANIGLPQSIWFLNALGDYQVPHSLDIEQLRGDGNLSGVPELTRLLVEAPAPQLRSLAARILRVVTHQDYGVVSLQAPEDRRRAIAERYLYLVDAAQDAKKR